jgi:signal transduction histidine kinase
MTLTPEQALLATHRMLQALTAVHTAFTQGSPAPQLFDPLLSELLELTGSEVGFIAEVVRSPEGRPCLHPQALTNLTWAPRPSEPSSEEARSLRISTLQILSEAVLMSGQPVVSNQRMTEEPHGGASEGHRPLRAFLGLPLHANNELVGLVGLANSPGGYDAPLISLLQPGMTICGALLVGMHGELRRRRTEEELRRTQERLLATERLASLGTLTAGMAHEINNPLAYMLSNLNFLKEELNTVIEAGEHLEGERAKELLDALSETLSGSRRVRDIVRDLRLFARNPPEQQGLVDLSALLDSCVNMAWAEIKHRAKLVKDYAPVPPLYGNESRLAQVFLHLILNAVQALPPQGGDSAEIRLSTRHESGMLMVSIHDTGVGIPEEDLERLFDPFFTTKSPLQGTGLGLSTCHRIVQELGGHITVESKPGRGSTFRVFLPTKVLPSIPEGPAGDHSQAAG